MTTDSITDKGTAISRGKKRRNNGTAISDSPKPKVERTKDATKLMIRINKTVNKGYVFDYFFERPNLQKLLMAQYLPTPNTSFQCQWVQPFPALQKVVVNSISTENTSKLWKLSQYRDPHWTE